MNTNTATDPQFRIREAFGEIDLPNRAADFDFTGTRPELSAHLVLEAERTGKGDFIILEIEPKQWAVWRRE